MLIVADCIWRQMLCSPAYIDPVEALDGEESQPEVKTKTPEYTRQPPARASTRISAFRSVTSASS
ncbi:MAG TPA: hypothetical protein GXX29_09265 [Firmicutes bacterium]|nr:hypothetical protein [Bacillota bacterium]